MFQTIYSAVAGLQQDVRDARTYALNAQRFALPRGGRVTPLSTYDPMREAKAIEAQLARPRDPEGGSEKTGQGAKDTAGKSVKESR